MTGCQIGVKVGVDANRDGSGTVRATVTLDAEAAGRVPDLATDLRVDDLRKAGWRVDGPRSAGGGSVRVEASRHFSDGTEATALVAQISGPTGPFRDFKLRRERHFFRTTTGFTGTIDLTSGVAGFSDPQLQQRLGSPLGVDQTALEKQLGTTLSRIFDVQVAARLPGHTTSNAPAQAANGAVWTPHLGEKVQLQAKASTLNSANVVLSVATVVLGALVVVAVVRRLMHRRS